MALFGWGAWQEPPPGGEGRPRQKGKSNNAAAASLLNRCFGKSGNLAGAAVRNDPATPQYILTLIEGEGEEKAKLSLEENILTFDCWRRWD